MVKDSNYEVDDETYNRLYHRDYQEYEAERIALSKQKQKQNEKPLRMFTFEEACMWPPPGRRRGYRPPWS
jgi:hypothetical protein